MLTPQPERHYLGEAGQRYHGEKRAIPDDGDSLGGPPAR